MPAKGGGGGNRKKTGSKTGSSGKDDSPESDDKGTDEIEDLVVDAANGTSQPIVSDLAKDFIQRFNALSFVDQRDAMTAINKSGLLHKNDIADAIVSLSDDDFKDMARTISIHAKKFQTPVVVPRDTNPWNTFVKEMHAKYGEQWKKENLSMRDKMKRCSEMWARKKENDLKMADSEKVGPDNRYITVYQYHPFYNGPHSPTQQPEDDEAGASPPSG
jgi:hypothetical protein